MIFTHNGVRFMATEHGIYRETHWTDCLLGGSFVVLRFWFEFSSDSERPR